MAMKRVALRWLVLWGMVGPAMGASLCGSDEEVFFDCPLKGSAKRVSLCGSRPLTSDSGYLQYRFGRPGAIELEFPRERAGSPRQFQLTHYIRPQVDRSELAFSNGGYRYALYDDYDGEQKPARRERGISVTGPGDTGKTVDLVCGNVSASRLAALATVVPCDPDNALNMGGCE